MAVEGTTPAEGMTPAEGTLAAGTAAADTVAVDTIAVDKAAADTVAVDTIAVGVAARKVVVPELGRMAGRPLGRVNMAGDFLEKQVLHVSGVHIHCRH